MHEKMYSMVRILVERCLQDRTIIDNEREIISLLTNRGFLQEDIFDVQKALLHPFGLTLFLASLVLAGLMFFVLDRWSGQALLVIILGFLAYAASTAVIHRWRALGEPIDGDENSPRPQEEGDDPLVLKAEEDVRANRGLGPEANTPDFRRFVQEAFEHLNDQAFLSQSESVPLLQHTLASIPSQSRGDGTQGELAPLENAQALREVLIAAIEQLRPPGEPISAGSPPALQYHILNERYVQHRTVAHITTRHSISEATYHRARQAAISALARHLQSQEDLNRGNGTNAAETGSKNR